MVVTFAVVHPGNWNGRKTGGCLVAARQTLLGNVVATSIHTQSRLEIRCWTLPPLFNSMSQSGPSGSYSVRRSMGSTNLALPGI